MRSAVAASGGAIGTSGRVRIPAVSSRLRVGPTSETGRAGVDLVILNRQTQARKSSNIGAGSMCDGRTGPFLLLPCQSYANGRGGEEIMENERRIMNIEEDSRREKIRDRVRTEIFLPSSPVRLRDQLRGREREYERTMSTLKVPGRSAFIYGERGVGKSSLAWTAAQEFNSSDEEPVRVTCHPAITFPRLIAQIAKRMHDALGTSAKVKKVTELGLKTSLVTLMHRLESETEGVPKEIDVNDAVELLEALVPKSVKRVVIVDELDAANDPVFRSNIAFFIKQLGDQQARLKFIFAGIAENVSELLTHHESAQRCMATIKLERLPLNVLRDVIVEGFKQIQISVNDVTAYRIATLSDGFAHFTHLIGLNMAIMALDQEVVPDELNGAPALEHAIRGAVADSETIVKEAYDKAVQKYASYEAVLWSVADHWELYRSTRQIRSSYERICKDLKRIGEHVEVGDSRKLTVMVNKLKGEAHGHALVGVAKRRSWFKIRLAMLRGYCRMVAAAKGVSVGRDYHDSSAGTAPPRLPPNWDAVPDKEDEDESGLLDHESFQNCCQEAALSYRHATIKAHAPCAVEVGDDADGYIVKVVLTATHRYEETETVAHADATTDKAKDVVDRLATLLVNHAHSLA